MNMRAKVSAIALSVLMVMSTFIVAIDVFSATASAESSEEPTIEILNLVATPLDGSVALEWDAPDGVVFDYYRVEYSPEEGVKGHKNVPGDETTTTVEGLTNGVEYTFTVIAIIGGEEICRSEEVTAMPTATPPFDTPGAPQNLKAIPGDGFVKLTWGIPAYDGFKPITHYVIYMNGELLKDDEDDESPEKFPGTTATIDGLINEVEYTFKVAAVNGIGEGEVSDEVTVTPREDIATIDGYVKYGDVPVAGATVSLLDESDNVILDATTDDKGYFWFEDVPVGLYKVNVEKFGYDYDGEEAVEVNVESNEHYELGVISIDPLPAKVELDVDEGTVGLENVNDEDSGLTSGSVYTISYTLNGETVEASLGTEVTISGYLYGMGSTDFDVKIEVRGETYIVAQGMTDEDGYFSEKFVFPTAPSGEYEIWVVTDLIVPRAIFSEILKIKFNGQEKEYLLEK
jgi:hypothetical protein